MTVFFTYWTYLVCVSYSRNHEWYILLPTKHIIICFKLFNAYDVPTINYTDINKKNYKK